MTVVVAGAGAFGTALAVSLAATGQRVVLWARDPEAAALIGHTRVNPRLPGIVLPHGVLVTSDPDSFAAADIVLLAVPAQSLRAFLAAHACRLGGKALVACGKGIDLVTLSGPSATILATIPDASVAVLTGPSFAADIAAGLPTALTIACADDAAGLRLQHDLSTPALRLYRTTDVTGAEIGGAVKNVIAIASGACMGAGLGASARAAIMTRGFAELRRLALRLGAQSETLAGLSGLGDLVLTCTSDQSRNFRYGFAIGSGDRPDPGATVEGIATSKAVSVLAKTLNLDLPISNVVAALCSGGLTVQDAVTILLNRPLKEE
jgi:glycerol-3-phosphate dehydrogenase (NAD(P)+)